MEKKIITISREFGSGGRTIGRMVAEKLGRNVEDILFFDDNYNADKTAKEAGLKVCGVYDETSEEYAKEIKNICDYYIYDFSEILDFRD